MLTIKVVSGDGREMVKEVSSVELRPASETARQRACVTYYGVGEEPRAIEDIYDGWVYVMNNNGKTVAIGQVALANFTNVQGLQPMGGNLWKDVASSTGGAKVGTPLSSDLGEIQSGALEESNVDLTAELVDMIVAQRFYQANAQTIKTQDAILQTLINLR